MGEFVTQVHKLDDRTYYFDQFDVHLYLFLGEKKALLWDTGFNVFTDLREAVEAITDLPLMVVQSHGHPDHCTGNLAFDEIYAHPDDFDAIRGYQGAEGNLKPINEGDVIDLGGRTFEVLHTPGHQQGHIALLNRSERILLPGDIIQKEHIVMYLPGVDWADYRKSLLRLKDMGSEYDIIYPSHGDVPMDKSQFDVVLACLDAYEAGELTPTDAVGPEGTKCKAYKLNGFEIMA